MDQATRPGTDLDARADLLRGEAHRLDRDDPPPDRAGVRLPPGKIYLDGNSLGPLSIGAERRVREALQQWSDEAVLAWESPDRPWFSLAEETASLMAPLVGASPGSVAVTGSTTVNIHQLLATLFNPRPGRDRILIDESAFPSDRYAVTSHLRIRGLGPEALAIAPAVDGLLDEEVIIRRLEGAVALALLPGVVYTTGQMLDMEKLAGAARDRGVSLVLDLSHSIGVIPHRLEEWGVAAAVWCGYKYLNGGPGAPSGIFLHPELQVLNPGLAGWWGSRKDLQLEMPREMVPADGAGALQIGSPHILSLAALFGALEQTSCLSVEVLRRRSLRLTAFLARCTDDLLPGEFHIATPMEPGRRGGHLAIEHEEAMRISRALRRRGVVVDYRPPNLIRLAPAPLYNLASECLDAVQAISLILREGAHLTESTRREAVS